MQKIINFANKTAEQLIQSMYNLRKRYRQVQIKRYLKNGLYYGYFSVISIKTKTKSKKEFFENTYKQQRFV